MAAPNQSLSDFVYQEIRQKVVSGAWDIGMRINEKQLAQSLHVSRTPIRWALLQLYQEGLLDYNKNNGYQIKRVTEEDVREIYKIRVALETVASYEAACKMSEEDFQVLEDIVQASRDAIAEDNFSEIMRLSTQFNLQIFTFAQMPRLRMIQKNLSDYLERFRNISFESPNNSRRLPAVEEHAQIVELMRKRDREGLEALIRRHVAKSEGYILEFLQKNPQLHPEK